MKKYCQIDHEIAESACDKLMKHRWQLCEESIVFGHFSDCLMTTKKKTIFEKILSFSHPNQFCRRIPFFRGGISETTQLADLVGTDMWFLFDCLKIDHSWLELSPKLWSTGESFLCGKDFVTNLKVVNDAAERNVKFHTD